MDDRLSSAAEDQWKDMAQAMRIQIEKQIPSMVKMKPNELGEFIKAAQSALWFEVNAETFDHHLELQRNKTAED